MKTIVARASMLELREYFESFGDLDDLFRNRGAKRARCRLVTASDIAGGC
jgi:hypothetical protein